MNTVLIALGVGLGIVVLYYTIILLGAFIAAPLIMWAWNGSIAVLFPTLFPVIGYWHGYWLSVLSGMLIKSSMTAQSNSK